MLPEGIRERLRAHQVKPAEQLFKLLGARTNCVDLSDTGTGKTYVATAVLAAMNRPTLAVVPYPAVTPWRKAQKHFDTEFNVLNYEMLRTGRTPYGRWERPAPEAEEYVLKCLNCQCTITEKSDPCHCRPDGIHCVSAVRKPHNYGKFIWHPGIDTLVFDEVHRCAGDDTLHSRMLIAAKRQGKRVLALSATAACTPLHLRALGYVLGLHTLTEKKDPFGSPYYATGLSFTSWARQYGCRWTAWGGFQWLVSKEERQRAIMERIHGTIVPSCGVRIAVKDVPNFPTRSIICQAYDIEAPGKLQKLYSAMADSLGRLAERQEQDKDPDNPMTVILRARQRVELLKVPLFVELTRDALANGNSVAIFVSFQETIAALWERLDVCCGIIDGSPAGVKCRDRVVEGFENDVYRVVLVNQAAGSEAIGLRDLRGVYPRVAFVSPTFSARTTRQLFGRLPRDGSKSHSIYYMVYAAGTVEEDIAVKLGKKLDNVDALNDADLTPKNLLEARRKYRQQKGKQ